MAINIILLAVFCALGGWCAGVWAGYTTHQYDYDKGWLDCEKSMKSEICDGLWEETRKENLNTLKDALEEIWEEEEKDNIIDCGSY